MWDSVYTCHRFTYEITVRWGSKPESEWQPSCYPLDHATFFLNLIGFFFRKCPCGRTKKNIKCGAKVSCKEICGKKLNCAEHTCKSVCHEGPCDDCDVIHTQTCFCETKTTRDVLCGDVTVEDQFYGGFSCKNECQKVLECGNHKCTVPCHSGTFQLVRPITWSFKIGLELSVIWIASNKWTNKTEFWTKNT